MLRARRVLATAFAATTLLATWVVPAGAADDEPTSTTTSESTGESSTEKPTSDPTAEPPPEPKVTPKPTPTPTTDVPHEGKTPTPGETDTPRDKPKEKPEGTGTEPKTGDEPDAPPKAEPQVAVDDSYDVHTLDVQTLDVLANDDVIDDSVIEITTEPANGTLATADDGRSLTYVAGSSVGTETFQYRVSSGGASSETATVTLDVTLGFDVPAGPMSTLGLVGIAALPVAADDSYEVMENRVLTVGTADGVLLNDTDATTAALVDDVDVGSLTLAADGSFVYFPGDDYSGSDSFTYTATGAGGTSAAATVTITVNPAPEGINDSYFMASDTTLTVAAADGVLSNDLNVTRVFGLSSNTPDQGTLIYLNEDGSFEYRPDPGFTGTDTFSYVVNESGSFDGATVEITVTSDPAVDDVVTTSVNTPVDFDVFVNDPPSSTRTALSDPAHGTLTTDSSTSGQMRYVPETDFIGLDSFTYTTQYGTANVNIFVGVDPSTGATDDDVSTIGDTPVTFDVYTNDPPGSSGVDFSEPQHGRLDPPLSRFSGEYTYTADTGHTGLDSFTYTTQFGTATVHITVSPGAQNDSYSMGPASGTPRLLTPSVLANDPDDSTIQSVTEPSHGLVFQSGGDVFYSPQSAFLGTDTFTYTTQYGTATVTITVSEEFAPVDDSYEVESDSTSLRLTPHVLANDPDGSVLTDIASFPDFGELTESGGDLYYTPLGFVGTVSFTYTTQFGTGTVTIDVGSTSLAPADDTYTVDENSADNTLAPLDNDPSGSVITDLSTPTQGGTVTAIGDTGELSFTPRSGFEGTTSFTYNTQYGTATVTITVTPEFPPVDDSYTVEPDSMFLELTPNVLANDPAGSAFDRITDFPDHGSVSPEDGGVLYYSPEPGYTGPDSFTYSTQYGTADVTIQVESTGFGPADDSYTVASDSSDNTFSPLDNDPAESEFVRIVGFPLHGTVTVIDGTDDLSYTPTAGYVGTDSVSYNTQYGTATISITVTDVPAPVANDDAWTVNEGTEVAVGVPGVLANDSGQLQLTDPAALESDVTHGTLDLNANGSFTYSHDVGFTGTDTFTYTATGPGGTSEPATVTITINDLPDPVAVDDAYIMPSVLGLTVAAPGVLGNDQNTAGATAEVVTGPSVGTLVLSPDGSFTYNSFTLPFVGDSFTYRLTGPGGTSAPVTVTLSPSSFELIARDDTYAVDADQTLTVPDSGVLANDTDGSGTGESVLLTSTQHGTLDLNEGGGFTYTPDAGFTGTDTFVYAIGSPLFGTSTAQATATITVNEVDAPAAVANDDTYTVPSSLALVVSAPGVLDNDQNIAGATAEVVSEPTAGTLVLSPDGSFTYNATTLPFFGDSFTYRLTGPGGTSAPATVTLSPTVVELTANDDSYTVEENQTLTVSDPGVLANDTVSTGAVAQGTLPTPQHGTLDLNSGGGFTYTPDTGFTGTDTFGYLIATPFSGFSAPATVTITVGEPPVPVDDSYTVPSSLALVVSAPGVLDNDQNIAGTTAEVVTEPTAGTLVLSPDGSFTYNATTLPFFGDSFTYRLTGPDGTSTPATVTLSPTVVELTANDDTYTVEENQTLTVSDPGVLANDTVSTGAVAQGTLPTPQHGTLDLNSGGGFTYIPDTGFTGTDTFGYLIATPFSGFSAPATVTITVNPVAPPTPTTDPDAYSTDQDVMLTVPAPGVLDNDDDADTIALEADVSDGQLSLSDDGGFTYLPDSGFTGTDTFTYTATGPGGTSAPETVTITVNEVEGAPVANDDFYDVDENEALAVGAPGFLGNDDNATGARLISSTDHGSLRFAGDGSFTYTPDDDYTGTDEFTYVATNDVRAGQLGQSVGGGFVTLDSGIATVTLTVNADPDSSDDDADGDSDGDRDGDSDDGDEDSDDDKAALPNTGSSVGPADLTAALLFVLIGGTLISATRRRGKHMA